MFQKKLAARGRRGFFTAVLVNRLLPLLVLAFTLFIIPMPVRSLPFQDNSLRHKALPTDALFLAQGGFLYTDSSKPGLVASLRFREMATLFGYIYYDTTAAAEWSFYGKTSWTFHRSFNLGEVSAGAAVGGQSNFQGRVFLRQTIIPAAWIFSTEIAYRFQGPEKLCVSFSLERELLQNVFLNLQFANYSPSYLFASEDYDSRPLNLGLRGEFLDNRLCLEIFITDLAGKHRKFGLQTDYSFSI